MSTKPTLGDYETPQETREAPHERVLKNRGAEYGKPSATPRRTHNGPENECLGCGAGVTPGEARVVGDENGCVPVCGECSPTHERTIRAAAEFRSAGGKR